MRQDYILRIFKQDARYKSGQRQVGEYVFQDRDDAGMQREINELAQLYPKTIYIFEFYPRFKTVTNLLTGDKVQIETDTPRCCDPSSETYWSM